MDAGMSADPTDIIRRIYLREARMDVGTAGDGDRGRDYRVRFLGHIIRGTTRSWATTGALWHRRYQ